MKCSIFFAPAPPPSRSVAIEIWTFKTCVNSVLDDYFLPIVNGTLLIREFKSTLNNITLPPKSFIFVTFWLFLVCKYFSFCHSCFSSNIDDLLILNFACSCYLQFSLCHGNHDLTHDSWTEILLVKHTV